MKLRIDALLLLVAAAGYVATSGPRVDPTRFGLLMASGLLAAAGASATNHYLDRDLDSLMRRTRARPLPQHRIDPPAHALEFGVAFLALGLGVAGFGINVLTAAMIGLGYAVYIGVYTLGLKRSHMSNIVIGGFAGSCPALAGSAAAANAISLPAALIAILVFLWTPGHFWRSPTAAETITAERGCRCCPRSETNARPFGRSPGRPRSLPSRASLSSSRAPSTSCTWSWPASRAPSSSGCR